MDETRPNIDLDRLKWEFDKAIREREISVKEREQTTKERDLDLRLAQQAASKWTSPLIVTILAAVVAGLLNVSVTYIGQNSQHELERERTEAARILEMIKTDPDRAAVNLSFLLNTKLVSDPETVKNINGYLHDRPKGGGVSLAPAAQLKEPIVPNARIFLLTGKKGSDAELGGLQRELVAKGFAIVGAKYLDDSGRPRGPEIRYFYLADQIQAQQLADAMKEKLKVSNLNANEYKGQAVSPGYLEIWLGK